MSDDFSARLGLPYLAAGQMQKHVTLNTALTRLDALLQTVVVSRTTTIQPENAADGDLYILPDGAAGPVWSGQPAHALMRFDGGGWKAVPAPIGLIALVLDTAVALVREEGGWVSLGRWLGEIQALSRLGVGTAADDVNPLAIKSNAALFTAREAGEGGDGNLRLTLNKEAASDVLSLLFQCGYGGRAEMGLIGGEDLSLKVSTDGSVWRRAFGVNRETGRVDFDCGATRRETTVFTSDGDYTPPIWARWIEAVCVGGGGGGGSGMAGAAGAPRFGGGGGGAGGLTEGRWSSTDLGGVLTITVGAGGVGAGGGAGVGSAGGAGGDSTLTFEDAVLARGSGGTGGGPGNASAGIGGAGGLGMRPANPGGASSIATTATSGGETLCPDGPGAGGAGGGVSASDAARSGGVGGAGAWSGRKAAGGATGAAGQASTMPELSCVGGGGGGGGGSAIGSGMAGGVGGAFGGGGGGGGAGLSFSGDGGAGGIGVVRITAVG